MNALPPSTGARHAPRAPCFSEQRTPVVRDPERFRRDGPPLRARRGGPGADPDEEAVDQPARIRRPAMPPLVSRPRHGTGRATAGGDDRLRGPINSPCHPPSSPTTRSGIRLAANMRSNCKDTDTRTTVDLASWVASQDLNGCRPPCFLIPRRHPWLEPRRRRSCLLAASSISTNSRPCVKSRFGCDGRAVSADCGRWESARFGRRLAPSSVELGIAARFRAPGKSLLRPADAPSRPAV
jgi:hypothetical protein